METTFANSCHPARPLACGVSASAPPWVGTGASQAESKGQGDPQRLCCSGLVHPCGGSGVRGSSTPGGPGGPGVPPPHGGSGDPGSSRRLWELGLVHLWRLWGTRGLSPHQRLWGSGARPPAAPLAAPSCGLEHLSPARAPCGKAGRPSRSRCWGRCLCRRRCRLEGPWAALSSLQNKLLFQPQTCCESMEAPGLERFSFSGLIAGCCFWAHAPWAVRWWPGPGCQIQRRSWSQSIEGRGRSLTLAVVGPETPGPSPG